MGGSNHLRQPIRERSLESRIQAMVLREINGLCTSRQVPQELEASLHREVLCQTRDGVV